MFRHAIPIGRIFGITIDLDYSWFLILGLLTWLLAVSYYPAEFQGWSTGEYWLIGFATAIMLFVSVLIHELGHSVVAQKFGMSVPRITLFVFGGVSQIADEPPSAKMEFWMAAIGPFVSFALAALFWEIEPLLAWSTPLYALCEYLALMNLILGAFNLIPGFPLDGGRVFRAIIWKFSGNYHRATSIAAGTGRFFGYAFILLGVWQMLAGNFFNGLWIAFIGWFLESAAGSQAQREKLKAVLGQHKVLDAMTRDFPRVAPEVTVQDLVDKHILQTGWQYFVVSDGDGRVGLVTPGAMREVPRPSWPTTPVSHVAVPLQKLDKTRPDAMLWSALEKMGRDGVEELPVVDGNGIVGMLSREDVVHYLRALRAFAT